MGPRSQYLETVLTCEGDFYSPDFHRQLSVFRERLHQLIFLAEDERNLILKKVEPWNSVKVTFNIPTDAARRLRELAERRDNILRELGVLAVQIDGDCVISLTVASNTGKNSESIPKVSKPVQAEDNIMLQTGSVTQAETSSNIDPGSKLLCPTSYAFSSLSGTTVAPSSCTTTQSCYKQQQPEFVITSSTPTSSGVRPVQQNVSTVVIAACHPNFCTSFPVSYASVAAVNVTLPSFSSVDANAMAAAVQLAQSKLLSGACQNIASSSPLLVNLLQTRRQMNAAAAITMQPSVTASNETNGGMLPPPPKRRRSQAKKSKAQASTIYPPRNVVSWPTLSSDPLRCPAAPVQFGIRQVFEKNEQLKSLPAEFNDGDDNKSSSTPRMLINPYTGTMELVEGAERDDINASSRIAMDNAVRSSNSLVLSLANSIGSRLRPDDLGRKSALQMPISNTGSMVLTLDSPKVSYASMIGYNRPISEGLSVPELCARFGIQALPAVCAQNSAGTYIVTNSCIPAATSVISNAVSAASGGLISDQRTRASHILGVGLSKTDANGLVSTTDSRLTNGLSDAQHVNLNVVSSFKNILPVIHTGSFRLNEQLENKFSIPVPVSNQLITVSCPSSLSTQASSGSASHSVGPAVNAQSHIIGQTVSATLAQVENGEMKNSLSSAVSIAVAASSGTGTFNLTVKDELMQLAYSYAKQNGCVLPFEDKKQTVSVPIQCTPCASLNIQSSLCETSTENKTLLNTIKSSIAVTCSNLQSSSGTAMSAESCFFPAVSCFPPEQRRRGEGRLVTIGGIVESQTLGTVIPTFAGTVPTVRMSTSDIPVTPLLSGSWLTATSIVGTESKNQALASATSVVNSSMSVCSTSQNALQTSVQDEKKPLTTQASSTPTSMYAVGLSSDALQRLIPKYFSMSAVSSSPVGGVPNMQAMTRAPSVLGLDGKLAVAGTRNAGGFWSACEANISVDKTTLENSSVTGLLQYVPAANAEALSKLRVVSTGKSFQRRCGASKTTEDAVLQRSNNKSHLTVAQLLERAKNAKLNQTASSDDSSVVVESNTELLASVSECSTNSLSPLHVSVPDAETSSKSIVDHVRIDASTHPVNSLSVSVTCPSPLPATSLPFPTLSAAIQHPVPLPPPPPSLAHIVPMTAFAMPRQLPIASPRYSINLTESVKKVLRGVGFYPSPPASPTTAIGRVLTGSKQMDVLNDGPSGDSAVVMMTTTELCAQFNKTDEQSVISNILDELSKNEPLTECTNIENDDVKKGTIQENCNSSVEMCSESTDLMLLEGSERDHSAPNLCSLPDLIVSTTGGNGCKTTQVDHSSSPYDDSQPEESTAKNEVVEDLKLDTEKDSLTNSTPCSTDSNSSVLQAVCSDEMPVDSTAKTNEEVDMVVNNFVSHTSPTESPAKTPSESAPTSEYPGIEVEKDMLKLPEKSVDSNDHIMKDSFVDHASSFGIIANSYVLVPEENSNGTSVSTLESLDGGCILVNGGTAECIVSEQAYTAGSLMPEMASEECNTIENSILTSTLEELTNTSGLVARPSTRRAKTVPHCTSGVAMETSPSPTLSSAALPGKTRMATRSSNRTSSSVAFDPTSTDTTPNSVKIASRRTPSKSVEGQLCSMVEAVTPVMQESELIAASNRRSVRAPRIITCNVDSKRSEPLLITSADSSTTGVSLRSRAKVTQLASTAKTSANSLAKKTISKGSACKQLDLSKNWTPDLVARTNENCVKCDLNGSEEIS